jgi:hypothetical protein
LELGDIAHPHVFANPTPTRSEPSRYQRRQGKEDQAEREQPATSNVVVFSESAPGETESEMSEAQLEQYGERKPNKTGDDRNDSDLLASPSQ